MYNLPEKAERRLNPESLNVQLANARDYRQTKGKLAVARAQFAESAW